MALSCWLTKITCGYRPLNWPLPALPLPALPLAALLAAAAAAAAPAAAGPAPVANNITGLVNVKTDFGDGQTDDFAAIQVAIDHGRITRNGIFFPAGNYRTTQPLILGFLVKDGEPGDNVWILHRNVWILH